MKNSYLFLLNALLSLYRCNDVRPILIQYFNFPGSRVQGAKGSREMKNSHLFLKEKTNSCWNRADFFPLEPFAFPLFISLGPSAP